MKRIKYTITNMAAAEVVKKVLLLPKLSQITPAITLASKVQMLSHEV
jgi:hypothetical protein